MEKEIFNKLVTNENIISNLKFYRNLEENVIKECNHIKINLGFNDTTFIKNGNNYIPMVYSKCILCGKNMALEHVNAAKTIDATNYKANIYPNTIEGMEYKYLDILEEFKKMAYTTSTEEKLISEIRKKIDIPKKDLVYKRAIKK